MIIIVMKAPNFYFAPGPENLRTGPDVSPLYKVYITYIRPSTLVRQNVITMFFDLCYTLYYIL
jgi:hypothetical protein